MDAPTARLEANLDHGPDYGLAVCICTYRRPAALAALLRALARLPRRLPATVVIVDNDAMGSARETTEALRKELPFAVDYSIQPEKNISLTRNQTISRAPAAAGWLAFLDDDEIPEPPWLDALCDTAVRHAADVVLAPVISEPSAAAPAWVHAGRFYDRPRHPTGTIVPANEYRMGNALIRRELLDRLPRRDGVGPFDPAFGLTGGEDGDMLSRLAATGVRIVWCDEAMVREPVEDARTKLDWLLRRAYRGGQDFARHTMAGRYGPVPGRVGRVRLGAGALVKAVTALGVAAVVLPAKGRGPALAWARKAVAQAGKVTSLLGHHYQEYR